MRKNNVPKLILATVLLLLSLSARPQQVIRTVAGTDDFTKTWNGSATDAMLATLNGIVVKGDDIYFASRDHYRIFKLDATGKLTVFAGNGVNDTLGDGGKATLAAMTQVFYRGMVFDSKGNFFFSDKNAIRKIDANGNISRFVGAYAQAASVDGNASTARFKSPWDIAIDEGDTLYVVTDNHDVRKVTPDGMVTTIAGISGTSGYEGDGGPASAAKISKPYGIRYFNRMLYIAEYGSHCIRKIDLNTKIISTVVGIKGEWDKIGSGIDNGANGVNVSIGGPRGVGIDASGNVYISCYDAAGAILKWNPTTGAVTHFAGILTKVTNPDQTYYYKANVTSYAGEGKAKEVPFQKLYCGVAFDKNGNCIVPDLFNNRLRKIDSEGNTSTIAGGGVKFGNGANEIVLSPRAVIKHNEVLYVSDANSNSIWKVDKDGNLSLFAGNGKHAWKGYAEGTGSAALFNDPRGLAVDASGNIIVADYGNHCIRKISPTGVTSLMAGKPGTGSYTDTTMNGPWGVAVKDGEIYFTDYNNYRIRKITSAGAIVNVLGKGAPTGVADAWDVDVAYSDTMRIGQPTNVEFMSNGALVFSERYSITKKVGGVDKKFYSFVVRMMFNNQVMIIGGTPKTAPGYGGDDGASTSAILNEPYGLALNAQDVIFIADTKNNLIRKFDPLSVDLTLTRVAGKLGTDNKPMAGFEGDGSDPKSAALKDPYDLSVYGNIMYIADNANSRVRMISVPVTGITIEGGNAISTQSGTLQLTAKITPEDASVKEIKWSVASGADFATLSETGLVTAKDNGTVQVKAEATDGSGMVATLDITISNQSNSVKDLAIRGLKIYPNPVSDKLYISANERIVSVELFDLVGKSLLREVYDGSNTIQFHFPETKGTYFLKIEDALGNRMVQKIIKQ